MADLLIKGEPDWHTKINQSYSDTEAFKTNILTSIDILLSNVMAGATVTVTLNESEDPSVITYVKNGETIRTDSFTYVDENTTTELRTLNTGKSVTLTHHSDTGITEIGEII